MIPSYKGDMIVSSVGKLIDHNSSFINRVQKPQNQCLHSTECFPHFQTLHPATKLSVLLDLFEYCTPRQLSETVHQNSCCDSYKGLASLIGLNVTLRIFLNIEISIQPKKFLLSLDNVIDTTNWSATVEVILLVSYYLCNQAGKEYEKAYKNGNKRQEQLDTQAKRH